MANRRNARSNAPCTPLTVEQIADGITKCAQSAHALYVAGRLTDWNGDGDVRAIRATARALLILAVEEYGKFGLLYWSLGLVHKGEADDWRLFWTWFTDHQVKNDIGRQMMNQPDTNLLPAVAHFFEHSFPFFSVTPKQLDLQKQAMLYVDFDHERRCFVSPAELFDSATLDNGPLIEEVEKIVRWVARNRQTYVFEVEVLRSYAELTASAADPTDLVRLIDALFVLVLRAEIPRETKPTLASIVEDLRRRHPDIDSLIERWTAVGGALHSGSDSVDS